MQVKETCEVQQECKNYEPPVLVELGNLQDLTRYDVSVIVGGGDS